MEKYYHKLGSYQLMITSKYFDNINDFKNLEYATKKAKGNMEKFHFNPLSLTKETRKYFTSLETLHIYKRGDEEFRDEKFYKRILHYDIDYEEYLRKKQEDDEYLNVILDKKSTEKMKEIPPGVTEIGNECFSYQDDITEIVLPDNITSIGQNCFNENNGLSNVVLSSTLKKIKFGCFYDLSSLKELSIPGSVTSIDGVICEKCSQLTSMIIPSEWHLFGNRYFNQRNKLCSFELPESVVVVNGEPIERNPIDKFDIPTYVTAIGDYAFIYDYQLKSIGIPTSVREIGCYAFAECKELRSIDISSVRRIGLKAFYGCISLESIEIPTSVSAFGRGCFFGTGITKQNYPKLPHHCFLP